MAHATQPAVPRPTPTHGSGGTFTVSCQTRIAAPPAACLAVVLDAASYPRWNRFCRACIVDGAGSGNGSDGTKKLALGTKFTFDVHMDLDEEVVEEGEEAEGRGGVVTGRATELEVSVLEAIDGGEGEEGLSGGSDGNDAGTKPHRRAGTAVEGRRKGWRVAWRTRGAMPGMVLRSERVQEFLEAEDGNGTDYVCWETFYGFLAPVVRMAVGTKLETGFGAWMEDLKHWAESLEGENSLQRR